LTAGKPIVGQIKKRESLGIDRDQCHVVIGIHIDYFGGKVAIGFNWQSKDYVESHGGQYNELIGFVDIGGWDTHVGEGGSGGYLASRFDELGRVTPWITNLKPSGKHLVRELHAAGGVPAVMKEMEALLDLRCLTVSGGTVGANLPAAGSLDHDVIRQTSEPLTVEAAIAVVFGNLAPKGAIIKASAASPHLMQHTGKAVVFENYEDMLARIESPDLDVDADSVLVLRNCGPKGAPGMPEWGSIPVPAKLQQSGVRDIVRISDARMSGTSYGTVVLHASPEAAAGAHWGWCAMAISFASTWNDARWNYWSTMWNWRLDAAVSRRPRASICAVIHACTSTMCCKPMRDAISISLGRATPRNCDSFRPLSEEADIV